MYKGICVRVLGKDAYLRYPQPPEAADDSGYATPFYDEPIEGGSADHTDSTPSHGPHPLNRDSVYDLGPRTPCSLTRDPIAKFVVINGYKFQYARSVPLAAVMEVSYGAAGLAPGDVLDEGATVFLPRESVGRQFRVVTRPVPPQDATPPYFHLDTARGGAEVPDHANAHYTDDSDRCDACSYWHTPARAWAASGRHTGTSRCNCPNRGGDDPPTLTRISEDLMTFTINDIKPARCITVTLTPEYGSMTLQPPSALQSLWWAKGLIALKHRCALPSAVQACLRTGEFYYAPLTPVGTARMVEDLLRLTAAAGAGRGFDKQRSASLSVSSSASTPTSASITSADALSVLFSNAVGRG
jgi:hypothetical protein